MGAKWQLDTRWSKQKARAQEGETALTSSDPWDAGSALSGRAGTKAW